MGIAKTSGLIVAGVVGIILLGVVGGSFYTVDQGEEAVILRNGAYVSTEQPGFHTKTPFIDGVVEHSLRQQTFTWESMEAYSNDQQPAQVRLSVTFQPLPLSGAEIYTEYGGTEGFISRVLQPRVPAIFKTVFGQFRAETSIKERERLNADTLTELRDGIPEISGLVNIVSVQVEDISFSPAYIDSIEQKQLATVEVERRQQLLAQERIQAQIVVTQAQARADSQLAEAEANAEAIRLRGNAEADAIDARGKALRENPNVVALVTAEKWDGVLPVTIPPNGTVPFLNVQPNATGRVVE